jgi:aquaporin Z
MCRSDQNWTGLANVFDLKFKEISNMDEVPMGRRVAAEFIGTFWLVFAGCGSAVICAHFMSTDATPVNMGVGFIGVGLAFGLTVLTMAYAIGHVSGCHLNPAVTLGLIAGGRCPAGYFVPYLIGQLLGALAGAGVLFVIASGQPGFNAVTSGFACNGYDAHSPGHYTMIAAILVEIVLTFAFLFVIMGATDSRSPAGFAPIAIGLCLTLFHLVAIPVDNLSVNPVRSLATAVFVGGWALQQLWVFIVAPIIGGILGGVVYKAVAGEPAKTA